MRPFLGSGGRRTGLGARPAGEPRVVRVSPGPRFGTNFSLRYTAPVAVLLTAATTNVVATPDFDKGYIRRWSEWIYDLASAFFSNEIKASIKNGNYNADTTAAPFNSLLAYKARPLNGIWATAPYLHNGSIPNLHQLLLPARERIPQFYVGKLEYDPEHVGFVTEAFEGGFKFDTTIPGNLNTGHEYGTGLSEQVRRELIEYLKTL